MFCACASLKARLVTKVAAGTRNKRLFMNYCLLRM
jgi:hypothetical protein